jgi:hypothetical protein
VDPRDRCAKPTGCRDASPRRRGRGDTDRCRTEIGTRPARRSLPSPTQTNVPAGGVVVGGASRPAWERQRREGGWTWTGAGGQRREAGPGLEQEGRGHAHAATPWRIGRTAPPDPDAVLPTLAPLIPPAACFSWFGGRSGGLAPVPRIFWPRCKACCARLTRVGRVRSRSGVVNREGSFLFFILLKRKE